MVEALSDVMAHSMKFFQLSKTVEEYILSSLESCLILHTAKYRKVQKQL